MGAREVRYYVRVYTSNFTQSCLVSRSFERGRLAADRCGVGPRWDKPKVGFSIEL